MVGGGWMGPCPSLSPSFPVFSALFLRLSLGLPSASCTVKVRSRLCSFVSFSPSTLSLPFFTPPDLLLSSLLQLTARVGVSSCGVAFKDVGNHGTRPCNPDCRVCARGISGADVCSLTFNLLTTHASTCAHPGASRGCCCVHCACADAAFV